MKRAVLSYYYTAFPLPKKQVRHLIDTYTKVDRCYKMICQIFFC